MWKMTNSKRMNKESNKYKSSVSDRIRAFSWYFYREQSPKSVSHFVCVFQEYIFTIDAINEIKWMGFCVCWVFRYNVCRILGLAEWKKNADSKKSMAMLKYGNKQRSASKYVTLVFINWRIASNDAIEIGTDFFPQIFLYAAFMAISIPHLWIIPYLQTYKQLQKITISIFLESFKIFLMFFVSILM